NMPQTASPMPNAITMDIVTENVKVTTSYAALKIRQSASSSGTILGSADKGTILLRIEKATAISDDGRYWDKVVYDTGTGIIVGYSARTDTDGAQYLTPVNDVITVNEEMQTSTDVNLRNGPGTSGTTVKQTLTSGIKLTVIDKMSYKVNNYCWYRVKLADGTQGYMASEYLKSIEEPNIPDIPENPDNPDPTPQNYKLDGNNLIIAPGTKITDIEGATLTGSVCGTGATITLNDNTYTLVILGDVSGDGEVKSKDYMMIKNYIMGTLSLNEAEKKAADVSKDNEIKSKDYMMIKNYIMGTASITL
ncbi:MAG: SH3 domain-containing protein, partial [Clostridia bacterium]